MIKVLLDESCFDKNGFVILVMIIDAILQAAGTERVRVSGLGRLWMYRTWSPPSEAERWNVNAEYALIEKINAGVKRGILKPFDSNTLERKGYGDIAGAVVSLEQLNAWGSWIDSKCEFERAHDEEVCAAGKKVKAGGRPKGQQGELLQEIIDALTAWATMQGESFDSNSMPGQVGNADEEGSFHWLCAKLYPGEFRKGKKAFKGYRAGRCVFPAYAKKSDFYSHAFSHIAQTLGRPLHTSATK